jgi:hypothetical protein
MHCLRTDKNKEILKGSHALEQGMRKMKAATIKKAGS